MKVLFFLDSASRNWCLSITLLLVVKKHAKKAFYDQFFLIIIARAILSHPYGIIALAITSMGETLIDMDQIITSTMHDHHRCNHCIVSIDLSI